MELNETKAIAGVPRSGPNSLYKYFYQHTSPNKQYKQRKKILKYEFNMFLINFNLPYKTPF